jgi:hypothetical protein
MTTLVWIMIAWLGALTYTLIGALTYRWLMWMFPELDGDGQGFWSFLWPIFWVIVAIMVPFRYIVYLPFRACVRKVVGEQPKP